MSTFFSVSSTLNSHDQYKENGLINFQGFEVRLSKIKGSTLKGRSKIFPKLSKQSSHVPKLTSLILLLAPLTIGHIVWMEDRIVLAHFQPSACQKSEDYNVYVYACTGMQL